MEYQNPRGRILLLMQSEKGKFWTLPPAVALNERGQVSQQRSSAESDDMLASVIVTTDMISYSIQTLEKTGRLRISDRAFVPGAARRSGRGRRR